MFWERYVSTVRMDTILRPQRAVHHMRILTRFFGTISGQNWLISRVLGKFATAEAVISSQAGP